MIGSTARGLWMGIAAVTLVVIALLFVVPGSDDAGKNPSGKVETTPAPNVTPK